MSSKSPTNWSRLHTEFLSYDGTRSAFFKENGIKRSTWTRHTGPKWDQDQAEYRKEIAELTKSKLVEREAETAAQALQRHVDIGKAAASIGWNALFEMKEGSDGKPIKVLRDDLHASDMVRLVQLGLQTEYRAKTALEKMHPAGTPGTPTGDNPDVKPQGQTPEEQNAVALNDELAAMREALKDPKKSEAAFQFVKALGLKSE